MLTFAYLCGNLSTLQLTVARSNAVSLYKLLQRWAVEAERQFEGLSLSRIGEDLHEIEDCNSYIYAAAGKLGTRSLEILSARLLQLYAQIPGDASSKEMQILRMLSSDMLDNSLPVGGSRYRSADTAGPEKALFSILPIIEAMETSGEVGAALQLHSEMFEQLFNASLAMVEKCLTKLFLLQDKFGHTIRPLLETLRVEPAPNISTLDWY